VEEVNATSSPSEMPLAGACTSVGAMSTAWELGGGYRAKTTGERHRFIICFLAFLLFHSLLERAKAVATSTSTLPYLCYTTCPLALVR
jgi:hypothetical protein